MVLGEGAEGNRYHITAPKSQAPFYCPAHLLPLPAEFPQHLQKPPSFLSSKAMLKRNFLLQGALLTMPYELSPELKVKLNDQLID